MKKALLAAVCVAGLATGADAATILTFDGIPPSGATVGLFTEAGFDLNVAGLFAGSEGGGTELEPLCCASGGSLTVTKSGGGTFTFDAVDLQKEYFDDAASTFLRLEGFLLGVSQGVDILSTSSSSYATFLASVLDNVAIDTLVVTGQRDVVAGIAFDNLALDAVVAAPEPASLFLVGSGIAALVIRRRRTQNS